MLPGAGGVLHYQGKSYAVKVAALAVGGIGLYKRSRPKVRSIFLNKLEDFAGKYGAISASAAAGSGKGVATLENLKKRNY